MITLENVGKKFGKRTLFTNLSITFHPGKVYALIGSSGCGKTTLLNMIAKIEDYDGTILYKEKNLKQYSNVHFFRSELGYLFQNFGLLQNQTVEDNLKLGLISQKMNKEKRKEKEKQALKNVGLEYLSLNQPIYELSGGEAQRIALAKLILKNPPLILADEPTASLDPTNSLDVISKLLEFKNSQRIIIIATHNPDIWKLADEVVNLNDL